MLADCDTPFVYKDTVRCRFHSTREKSLFLRLKIHGQLSIEETENLVNEKSSRGREFELDFMLLPSLGLYVVNCILFCNVLYNNRVTTNSSILLIVFLFNYTDEFF